MMPPRITTLLLILWFICSSTTLAEQVVRLTNGEWSPWFGETLPKFGPASEIVSEAMALEGWRVEYSFYPWARAFELAKAGHYDGTVGWSRIPERETYFLFSEPIFSDYDMLFHRRDLAFDWRGDVRELTSYTLGRTLSYSYGEVFDAFARAPTVHVEIATSDVLNLIKLLNRRIELFPLSWRVGMLLLQQELTPEQAAQLTCHPLPLRVAYYRVLFSKKSPQAQAAQLALNRGLAKLSASGRLQQILAAVEPNPAAPTVAFPCRPKIFQERVK